VDWIALWQLDEDRAAMKFLRALGYLLFAAFLLIPRPASAHVGSKDVFEEASAGPYKLYVTVRMPNVIPGVAIVEVRSTGAPVSGIDITPLPLTGEGSTHAPTADAMKPSAADPAFYTGSVWMMTTGSWQVRFAIKGAAGTLTTAVPVSATAITTLGMDRPLSITLAVLGLLLFFGMAGIVAAAIRESRLPVGDKATPSARRRSLVAMGVSLAVMLVAILLGAKWWNVEAASFSDYVYHPLHTEAQLSENQLDLKITSFTPGNPFLSRANSDFIPDHGKLMHLYAIRQPGLDAVYHLHPTQIAAGDFRLALPSMPAGTYNLYGDVVHANGFPETLVTTLAVPAGMTAAPAGADDASAQTSPVTAPPLGTSFRLPDGYTMVWDPPAKLTADTAYSFHFRLLAPNGGPATDMQPYMGMAGHAAFVKLDGSVFAHVHPEGSAAMAAVMLANPGEPSSPNSMADMPGMAGMSHPPGAAQALDSNTVDFPYGFPTPGRYRIIVQMKHNTTVETGVFDATAQ
jgi:hypothetical protein